MDNKLYVGNLPYSMRDDDLQQHFARFGAVVSAKVMTERETGRSKGFAFVEMSSRNEAQQAIEGMHGRSFEGRALIVNVSRPPAPRTGGYGSERGSFGSDRYNH